MNKTTAIYPNRKKDKENLERARQLPEFGEGIDIKFFTSDGPIVAKGYERILYGDHGPYIEFASAQVHWDKLRCTRKGKGWYNKWFSSDGVLFYDQLRSVSKLKNPPKDKKKEAFRGDRKEGYADYKPGMVYVDPEHVRTAKRIKKIIKSREEWKALKKEMLEKRAKKDAK